MNRGPEPESLREVPEADALEQKTPVLPEVSEESELMHPLPGDAPEADVMEQRTEVLPGAAGSAGSAGRAGFSETEASEADLVEQALAPTFDDEEDYREEQEDIG